jgi:hypothetical protein
VLTNDLPKGEELLACALADARAVGFVEEELQATIWLVELRRRRSDLKGARELLEDVWELVERGPYPVFHANARNVLAHIERDAGNPKRWNRSCRCGLQAGVV